MKIQWKIQPLDYYVFKQYIYDAQPTMESWHQVILKAYHDPSAQVS